MMTGYKVEILVLGAIATNCYIVYKEGDDRAVVIDPAAQEDVIISRLEKRGLRAEAILLTHAHFDHILAADHLKEKYGCKIYAHELETDLAGDPQQNLSGIMGRSACRLKIDTYICDEEQLEIAGLSFVVLHTPGHTAGSVCYYSKEAGLLFSGDTLFAGSVGRTDFPTGSGSDMMRSVRERLSILPDATIVYPGHGEASTIGEEKKYNPYM